MACRQATFEKAHLLTSDIVVRKSFDLWNALILSIKTHSVDFLDNLISGRIYGQKAKNRLLVYGAPMTLVGYARVSTSDQDPALQLDALRHAGVQRVFEDRGVSGAKTERPGLRVSNKPSRRFY